MSFSLAVTRCDFLSLPGFFFLAILLLSLFLRTVRYCVWFGFLWLLKMKCEFFPQGSWQSCDHLRCEPKPFSLFIPGKMINDLFGSRVLRILCLSEQGSMHALWHARDEGMGNRNPHQVCQRGFSRFWENVFDWRYLLCREPRPQTG